MKIYKIYFLFHKYLPAALICMATFYLSSCSQKNFPAKVLGFSISPANEVTDYSNLDNWAAIPLKPNLSDSIPASLKNETNLIKEADVFFIHPTTFTDYEDDSWNASITNMELNSKTDRTSILYQASVFNNSCRVYAPRYRQAHIKAFYIPKNESEQYFDLAYDDIKNAFEYYLENYNHGRPIIIASHSQGTLHAARLLKEYFEGKLLQDKLVCAYIIGLPVPENYFFSLPACQDSLSTGCFVSWRTFKQGYEPKFVREEKFRAVVVNPLTWTMKTDFVPSSMNKGGVLKNFNKVVPHVVSAQIHKNILWTSKPEVFGNIFLMNKNYHIGDFNLFYLNIRNNVKTRISSFENKLTTQEQH